VAHRAYNQPQNFVNPLQCLHTSSVSTGKRRDTMLRVGLTGGLGSGKTTVAGIFRLLGAHVLEADEVGRALMEPGQPVFDAIVKSFGAHVVKADGRLDRRRLAEIVFHSDSGTPGSGEQNNREQNRGRQNRIAELNRIVHPPVIAEQQRWADELSVRDPSAVAIVESALIFEADQQGTAPGWRQRFDRIVLVTAPVETRIARYVERMRQRPGALAAAEIEADARGRLAAQMPDSEKIPLADYVIRNDGSPDATRQQAEHIYAELATAAGV
jgi:dephospho-CoA kinase